MHFGFLKTIPSVTVNCLHTLPINITHVLSDITGFWWGNLRVRDHLGDPVVDGRIILRWIFRKWGVGVWTGSSWLRIGTGEEHL